MKEPMFPSVAIDVSGPDGNAYAIMGVISHVLRTVGYSKNEIDDVLKDMMSSNYEHLIEVASKYVTIENMNCMEES